MLFNRLTAKMSAKMSIRNARPHPCLVTVVYIALTVVLTNLVLGLVGDSFQEAFYYLQSGYDPAEVFRYVFIQNSGKAATFGVLNMLFQLFNAIMAYGYSVYAMKVARNQQTEIKNLFVGFGHIGRVLWMHILIGIFSTLWMALFILPSIVIMIVSLVLESGVLLMFYFLALVIGGIAGTIFILRYNMSVYFMVDHDCSAREAIRLSKTAMKGRTGELFALELSFIGWIFLSAITMGIFSIWTLPYMETTIVNYYDVIRTPVSPEDATYTGQVYHFGPGSNQY